MKLAASLVTIGTLSLLGCATTTSPMAMATLEPRSGSNVRGTVHFTQMNDGNVKVKVDLTGLPPGVHGFHLHESPDCSAADASSAGPHFNPTGAPHGGPGPGSHAGDWGNVIADDRGEVHTEVMTRSVSVTEGMSSVIGRSVVAHADRDDLTSQPAGNAGKRVACGAVTIMTGSMR